MVTGVPDAGKTVVATALAERLGCALVSLDEIEDELAVDAEDTPRAWLRYDAEQEVVRRLEAFDGEAVVDIWIAPRRDTERVRDLLEAVVGPNGRGAVRGRRRPCRRAVRRAPAVVAPPPARRGHRWRGSATRPSTPRRSVRPAR